jgi:DNA mismatch repair ATPase MutS
MGHVTLTSSQVRNPANLEKSLIITGPNAAGKTTYVRAIFTNIILAQSLGIACASHAYILPVHAWGTFMRISDTLGTSSLFEAEVKRCAELINQAQTISVQGKRAIYFLDEPMHSTPPIEGSATSKAVIEYIGAIPNVRILVTTHYHDLVSMKPRLFKNVSMDAIEQTTGTGAGTGAGSSSTYIFPYKIQNGPSFKCIALELLEVNKLPSIVVAEAIKIKNNYIKKLSI